MRHLIVVLVALAAVVGFYVLGALTDSDTARWIAVIGFLGALAFLLLYGAIRFIVWVVRRLSPQQP